MNELMKESNKLIHEGVKLVKKLNEFCLNCRNWNVWMNDNEGIEFMNEPH